jgi:membrane protein DedA with SNARE-associated domain/rhodanese-related sulfurtransferase
MNLTGLLLEWGLPLVFAAVLSEQGGLPLPAAPLLICAGAVSATGSMRLEQALLTAFSACLLTDHVWFITGRRFGRRLLAGLCRVSLSPDNCVRRTDNLITRRGPAVLVIAKFIPGVSALAIPTAAAAGLAYRRFLLFAGSGGLLWCSAYIAAGYVFSRQVNDLLRALDWIGGWVFVALPACFLLYLAWKLVYRWRLRRLYRLVRIAPQELVALRTAEPGVLILDARSALARSEDQRLLPGAMLVEGDTFHQHLPADAHKRTIVTFCTCPNEAGAAVLAKKLLDLGYSRVRVLTGGVDAISHLNQTVS